MLNLCCGTSVYFTFLDMHCIQIQCCTRTVYVVTMHKGYGLLLLVILAFVSFSYHKLHRHYSCQTTAAYVECQ